MSERGYRDMIAVLGYLPGTIEEIASRTGLTDLIVGRWLRQAQLLRLVHVSKVEHVGPWLFARTFAIGPGEPCAWPHDSRKRRRHPGVLMATLAAIYRAIEEPHTAPEISEETGVHGRQLHDLLVLMQDAGLARRAGWHCVGTNWIAEWGRGPGADVARPRRQSRKVVNAKAWRRRRERLAAQALQAAITGKIAA